MSGNTIIVRISNMSDLQFVNNIIDEIELSSAMSGVNILKRSPQLISMKLMNGEAIIAYTSKNDWVGFSFIQEWDNGKFTANCALVVNHKFRKKGIAGRIKKKILDLSLILYPQAKVFGLTTSLAVMKINSDLGYIPVTYAELPQNDDYWSACMVCPNYKILESRKRKNCLCTAMLYSPTIK